MAEAITFWAQIAKVQTLADGGLRFTFDAPESAIMAAAELMAFKRHGVVADVVVTVHNCKTEESNALDEGPKRQSKWATEEKPGADVDIGKSGEQNP